jgi:aspartate aminotransferase-like enzyme
MLLMTPGPTRVPDRVLKAGAREMLHHRSADFSRELGTMLELLHGVFGTVEPVLPVHTTGRGAMEAAICNLLSPADEIISCCNGKFGELWARLAESYGIRVHRIATDWSQDVDPSVLGETLRDHPGVRAVTVSYCDTSTGVRNDIREIATIAHGRGAMILVDGVSSIGGMPFSFDEWEIDFAVTASQKCLMSSPGLAFVALNARAWSASASSTLPRNYWNFDAIRRDTTKPKPETPGTTPVHLVFQVTEALRQIHEEGLVRVFERHEQVASLARRGAARMGLPNLFPDLRALAPTVTPLAVPPGVVPRVLRDRIRARGILVAAAMGDYEPFGIRIGHLGDIRLHDVERTLTAIGESLGENDADR